MKCKKSVSLLVICIMVITLLAGCGQSKSTKSGEDNKKNNDNKEVIKVGMEVSYPPFEYYEEDGTTIVDMRFYNNEIADLFMILFYEMGNIPINTNYYEVLLSVREKIKKSKMSEE